MIELEYDNTLVLSLPARSPENLRHFAQNFRMHYLLSILGQDNTDALNNSYAWAERCVNVVDLLCGVPAGGTIPMALMREKTRLEGDFINTFNGLDMMPLRRMTFQQMSYQYSIGFTTCFMKDMYCEICDEMEFLGGMLVNARDVIRGTGPTVEAIRNHYNRGTVNSPSLNTRSCPYCKPNEFELGSWRRLLYRPPNVCACDACGR